MRDFDIKLFTFNQEAEFFLRFQKQCEMSINLKKKPILLKHIACVHPSKFSMEIYLLLVKKFFLIASVCFFVCLSVSPYKQTAGRQADPWIKIFASSPMLCPA